MSKHEADTHINGVTYFLKLISRTPCCCQQCIPRIRLVRELGGKILYGYGFLNIKWENNNNIIIVPDDPGCFVTRVLEGFGTILSCTGLSEHVFNAIVYDEELNIIGRVVVKYRKTPHTSYHYIEKELRNYKYIIMPENRLVVGNGQLIGGIGFARILAQAIGFYAAKNLGYELLLVHTSTIIPGNELRKNMEGKKIIAIGPQLLYNIVTDIIDKQNTFNIVIEGNKISINRLKEILELLEQKRQV